MKIEGQIRTKLEKEFQPEHLELLNESSQHNVPEGSESHFRLLIVSEAFVGQSRVQRQRMVYGLLNEELAGPVHALSMRALSPEEWQKSTEFPASPNCRGGSKA